MRHIVALSGGKDSTALALALHHAEPVTNFEYVITPTGDELPEMVAHWIKLSRIFNKKLLRLEAPTLNGLIQLQRAIPNHQQRWCTRMIKIEPYKQFLYTAAPCVSYVGLRADEPDREGIYGAIEGVTFRYPLREWGWRIRDVWSFLDNNGITIPPRTDCARCFYQRIVEWWNLWRDHRDIFDEAAQQEIDVGHTFRTPGRDSWPVSLKELSEAFASGRRPQHAGQLTLLEDRGEMCRVCSL